MMNMHLLDRADEEITRITKICDGLPEYFLKRMNLLKEGIADIDANDDSFVAQGMRQYVENLLINETIVMNVVVGKLQSVGLAMDVRNSNNIINNNIISNTHINNNSSSHSDNDNDNDNDDDDEEEEVEEEEEDEAEDEDHQLV